MLILLKLAFRNIIRTPLVNIVKCAILFALMFAVFITVSVWKGLDYGLNETIKQSGNMVRLEPNYNEFYNDKDEKIVLSYITRSQGQSLINSKYINDYNYHLQVFASSMLLPAVFEADGIKVTSKADADNGSYSYAILGDRRMELLPEFKNGSLKLVSGEYHSQNGSSCKNGAVISKLLAYNNNLTIGSIFFISTGNSKLNYELRVVGIFERSSQGRFDIPYSMKVNSIYVPLEIAFNLNRNIDHGAPSDELTDIAYYLNRPEDVDAFIDEAESKGLDLNKYKLGVNYNDYMLEARQLLMLKRQTGFAFIFVLILSMVIICIFEISAVRKRCIEFGYMRAIGIGKGKILSILIAEIILIGILSLILSGVAGVLRAPYISGFLLKEQLQMVNNTVSVSSVVITEGNSSMTAAYGSADEFHGNTTDNGKITDKIKIINGPAQYMSFILAGLFIILFCISTTLFYVIRFKPINVPYGKDNGG